MLYLLLLLIFCLFCWCMIKVGMTTTNDIDRQYARRVISIYIDGAIGISRSLGIKEFVMVCGQGDLNKSTDHTANNGWRYKILPDGSVYIGSIAMQQLSISLGLSAALPWVQNHCNPKITVRLINGRFIGSINQQLLMRSGDVETNPGPVLYRVVVAIVCCYLAMTVYERLDFSTRQEFGKFADRLSQGITIGYARCKDFLASNLQLLMEDHFGDTVIFCADEFDKYEYARDMSRIWVFGKFYISIHQLFGSNDHRIGRPSLLCRMLDKIIILPRNSSFVVEVIVAWTLSCVFLATVISTICVVFLRRMYNQPISVRVINKQIPFIPNQLRNNFSKFMDELSITGHKVGTHSILAAERRDCELYCFNEFLDKFDRVRDVGGSRNRFPHLGFRKHICCPDFNNDDVQRNAKDIGLFENCHQLGQNCPRLSEIPCAILSHVDYHVSIAELTRIVVGPTFIINHDFNVHRHGVGSYGDGLFEASVSVRNGKVTMIPECGTPYVDHPYHHWKSEGVVVSKYGAFTYVKIGERGSTSVYYCHPGDGIYRFNDVANLKTSNTKAYPIIAGWSMSENDTGEFVFSKFEDVKTLPIAVVTEVALGMATHPRDDKYFDVSRSYLTGKLKSYQCDTHHLEVVLRFCGYLADVYALNDVHDLTVIQGNPISYGVFLRCYYKMLLYVRRHCPNLTEQTYKILGYRLTKKLIPWNFSTIAIASYETYCQQINSKFGNGSIRSFAKEPFQNDATSISSGLIECGVSSAEQILEQRDDFIGDTSIKCISTTVAPVDVANAKESYICANDITPYTESRDEMALNQEWRDLCSSIEPIDSSTESIPESSESQGFVGDGEECSIAANYLVHHQPVKPVSNNESNECIIGVAADFNADGGNVYVTCGAKKSEVIPISRLCGNGLRIIGIQECDVEKIVRSIVYSLQNNGYGWSNQHTRLVIWALSYFANEVRFEHNQPDIIESYGILLHNNGSDNSHPNQAIGFHTMGFTISQKSSGSVVNRVIKSKRRKHKSF